MCTTPAGGVWTGLADQSERIDGLDGEERLVARELTALVKATGSTLVEPRGIATRSAAELFVEVGAAVLTGRSPTMRCRAITRQPAE